MRYVGPRPFRLVIAAAVLLVAGSSAAPAAASSPLHIAMAYSGSGHWATTYRSQPPNQGGDPDHNYADDSSTQRWKLRYAPALSVAACGLRTGSARGCRSAATLDTATGATAATGHVDHTHLDGLFTDDNMAEKCEVRAATPGGARLTASVTVRYRPAARAIQVQALIPVGDALLGLPGQCPGQGDSLDGLADNYYAPGFSFKLGYGPERWFASRAVLVSLKQLRRAGRVRLSLAQTPHGTPPKHCAVQHPAYEQCTVSGAWSGTLVVSAR